MTGNDVQAAVQFLVEEQDKKIRREQENLERQAEIQYNSIPVYRSLLFYRSKHGTNCMNLQGTAEIWCYSYEQAHRFATVRVFGFSRVSNRKLCDLIFPS